VSRPKGVPQKIPVGKKKNLSPPLKGPTRGSENFAQNVGLWEEGTLLLVVQISVNRTQIIRYAYVTLEKY
jgi:hypothetical protein